MKNKYFIKTFLVCLLFALASACNKNNNQYFLDSAQELLDSKSDSALQILNKIENRYQLEGKQKADYWRLLSHAHSKKHHAMANDSLILFSLNYYQEVKDTTNILETYLLAGEYYQWKKQIDSAYILFDKGLLTAIESKDSVSAATFLRKLGNIDLTQNKTQKAIRHFTERIHYTKDTHNSYYIVGLLIDNDSTNYYLDKSVELALLQKDTLSAAHYLRNSASKNLQNKDYANAIKLVRKTGELSNFYKDFGSNHQILTEVFIATNKLDSAQYYLDKAKNETRKSSFGSFNDRNIITNKNALYALQAVIDAKKGKEYDLTSMYRFNDFIIAENISNDKILLEQVSESNRLTQENLILQINRQRTQIILIVVFVFIILAAITVYIYHIKRKRKLEEVEERTQSLQRLFREALSVKDEKQNNSQLFRKTLLQQLGIIKLVATANKQSNALLPQIIDISNELVSTDSLLNWEDLYSIIDSVYDNFYSKLNEKYVDVLNEKEIQMCCLLVADFSTVEISAVMQQSMQTIYQRKTSVRNKLKMKGKEDVLEFLNTQFQA